MPERRFRGIPLRREFVENLAITEEKPLGKLATTWPGRFTHLDRFVAREFLRHLPKGSEVRFLDAASSPGPKGAITTQEAVKTFKLLGKVDVSATSSDWNMPLHLIERIHRGIVYRKENLFRPPSKKEIDKYDVIRMANTIQHFAPQEASAAMENIIRRLRVGGLLIVNSVLRGLPEEPFVILQKEASGKLSPVYVLPTGRPMKNLPKTGKKELDQKIWERMAWLRNFGQTRIQDYKTVNEIARRESGITFNRQKFLKAARELFLTKNAPPRIGSIPLPPSRE